MKAVLTILISVLLLSAGCTKKEIEVIDNTDGPVSDTPYVEFSSVKPGAVVALKDSIVFTIFYRDGNSDIGFPEADSLSLFITDNRLNLTQGYYVKPVAPMNANFAVQGHLKIKLPYTFLNDTTKSAEMGTFSVKLKDRAGYWSNDAISDPIEIRKN